MIATQYHLGSKTIFLSMLAVAISLSAVVGMRQYKTQSRIVSATPITVENDMPTIFLSQEEVVSQISSDGTKKLIMKITNNKGASKTYTFSTSDGAEGSENIVFKKTLDAKKSMKVPYNAWSPDNKYFFIQEDGEGGQTVMVFNVTGEAFVDQTKYLDLTESFKQRGSTYNFDEATGWASETLVLFNTTTQENAKGPSYWFEVPSSAVIQLGTQF